MVTFEHPAAHRPGDADPEWANMRRIVVVRPDNVGDVLMAGPAVRALAAAAPRAEIDLLVSPGGAAAAALLPEVHETVTASVSWQQLSDAGAGEERDPDAGLVATLAARRYDAAVVLTSFSQSPWPAATVCRRAGIPVRVGTSKEFGGPALTHWVPAPPDDGHQVDRALTLLARVGVPERGTNLTAEVSEEARDRAAALVDGPFALVAPGASCPSRRYPAQRFAAVGARLIDAGLDVVVTGTGKEADLVRAAAPPGARTIAGGLDLPVLAALTERAAVVVANNSGGTHLADAVGTPVVVLFAGTETPRQYRPRSVPAAVLGRPVTCSPCRQLVCPFENECLDVPAGEVATAALGLITNRSGHPGR